MLLSTFEGDATSTEESESFLEYLPEQGIGMFPVSPFLLRPGLLSPGCRYRTAMRGGP